MKKIALTITILFSTVLAVISEPFIVSVPPLPDKSSQELYEEEELFALTVLNYYSVACGIETLIRINGVSPTTIVPIPTLEELEDADFKIIRKYHRICLDLKNQYDTEQLNYRDAEIESLLENLRACRMMNMRLQSENRQLTLENDKIGFYKKSNEELIDETVAKRFLADSLYLLYHRAKEDAYVDMQERIQKSRRNMYPVVSILAGTNKTYLYKNQITENNGISGQIVFNPGPIINVGRYFDLRGGVNHYSLEGLGRRYYSTSYEYSADLIMPLHELMNTKKLSLEIKLGLGFYNTRAYCPNTNVPDFEQAGELVRIELDAFNFGCEFPVGIYAGYTFYHNSRNAVYRGLTQNVSLGKNWHNGLNIGLSLALWNKLY